MRKPLLFLFTAGIAWTTLALADQRDAFDYDFQISYERSALEGRSLGDDAMQDRLTEEDYEFEFALEYRVSNDFYLFFTAALIDESETVETFGSEENVSGLERKAIGLGYFFGDDLVSHLRLGRTEFVNASEWWLWWDEELDAIRLDSSYADFEATLGLAEELARESTGVDFIDPEFEDVRRLLFSLDWEFAEDQSLQLFYLDQVDNSASFNVGEFEDNDRLDEEDADLDWVGIGYLGQFDHESAGEFDIELHAARVSGDETVYEFEDPVAGRAEVGEKSSRKVSGNAYGLRLGWSPPMLSNWRFILGRAVGSGDDDLLDNRVGNFRQTGLQGDSETLGELYQPELSNLVVDLYGIEWQVTDDVQLALLSYDYEQDELADEMRDVAIEFDLNGTDRDLGREVDLVITIENRQGLELVITAAEFDAGSAYGERDDETSSFIKFEIAYEF